MHTCTYGSSYFEQGYLEAQLVAICGFGTERSNGVDNAHPLRFKCLFFFSGMSSGNPNPPDELFLRRWNCDPGGGLQLLGLAVGGICFFIIAHLKKFIISFPNNNDVNIFHSYWHKITITNPRMLPKKIELPILMILYVYVYFWSCAWYMYMGYICFLYMLQSENIFSMQIFHVVKKQSLKVGAGYAYNRRAVFVTCTTSILRRGCPLFCTVTRDFASMWPFRQ